MSEIIQILQSHSPQYGDVQVILLRFCWNSKWSPRINFNFFGVTKTLIKLIKLNLFKFYNHIPHDMEMCMSFFKVFTEFKIAAMYELHNFLWAQKLNNLSQK